MAVVAIAALDCGIVQGLFNIANRSDNGMFCPSVWPLILGALPMANILTVAIILGYRRRVSQPFLLGFVAFGLIALVAFTYSAIHINELVKLYLYACLGPLMTA